MTSSFPEGRAIVYCEGAFRTTNGKTAHGLVRKTRRYEVVSVIDSTCAGNDAGALLDGVACGIPVVVDLPSAMQHAQRTGRKATHLVVGVAPDGGRLTSSAKADVRLAVELGLNVDCGLHDYLTEDDELMRLAERSGARVRDVRKPPPRERLHFFSGKIEQVHSLKVALLGTDSAVGKRTTAWKLVEGLQAEGIQTEMVGTGQTAWMQGARFTIPLDSLINDFLSGEIEHVVWSAWKEASPQVIVIEGQGSLMNPAYPGGYEILAAARPDIVVLQHAPARKEYDGFPGYPMHPIDRQIQAIETVSDIPVVAIALNHEGLVGEDIPRACEELERTTGLPCTDVLMEGPAKLTQVVRTYLESHAEQRES